MALYSVRSERACCKELAYNLPCRWFLDMDLMERSFDATVFTQNRLRLRTHDAGRALFDEVVWTADGEGLLLDEHVSVDGTLIEAAASRKSYRSKEGSPPPSDEDPGNPSVGFRGKCRRNETHAGATDPEARLLRKGQGQEVRSAFPGPALRENRHGLLMDFTVSQAIGTAKRDAVPEFLDGLRERGYRPRTRWGPTAATTPRTVYGTSGHDGDPACGTEEAALDHQRSYDAPCRLCGEPAPPQAGGGGLRLDEDGRRLPAHPLPGRGPYRPSRLPGGNRLPPSPHGQVATVWMMLQCNQIQIWIAESPELFRWRDVLMRSIGTNISVTLVFSLLVAAPIWMAWRWWFERLAQRRSRSPTPNMPLPSALPKQNQPRRDLGTPFGRQPHPADTGAPDPYRSLLLSRPFLLGASVLFLIAVRCGAVVELTVQAVNPAP